jgi:hypothetical protein
VRRAVVDESLEEIEVHPPGLYRRLVDACVASARELLDQQELLAETPCPACGSLDPELAFEKHGYTYRSCRICATLFISPRPSRSQMDWYLRRSPAAAFRQTAEYRAAKDQRTRELAAYRADWVWELSERAGGDGDRPVVDVETRTAAFLEGLVRRRVGPLVAAGPLCSPADLLPSRADTLSIVEDLGDLEGTNARLVALFDVLERAASPGNLVEAAHEALGPGGLLVITARSASGFDVQVLWERATIFPLEHVNLLSVEGVRALLTGIGFDIVELSTPGQLDVQMVERMLEERPGIAVPRFVRYFLEHRDRHAKRRLQQFLQENRLSSHLRLVARKVDES